jgi:hypothetical protein
MDAAEDVPSEAVVDMPSDETAMPAPTWFRRRRRGWLQRSIASLSAGIAVYGFTILLCIPPVIFFGAGIWSVIAYARTLFTLWNFVEHGQIQASLTASAARTSRCAWRWRVAHTLHCSSR